MTALHYLTIHEAAKLIAGRQLSPVELVDAVIRRAELLEPRLNAYITPLFGQARAAARIAEQEVIDNHYRGPLHGIPIAIKDNYWTAGIRTTAGSKLFEDFVPDQDSAAVARLNNAGAIITGKCNMHELAAGGTSTNVHFGAVHNPWLPDRIPGGSSGGSAAAVCAGLAMAALGTDTAGSIRQPAAHCGLTGLKPTYGRVSLFGVVPLSWSLDHAGPITRDALDCGLVMNVLAGHDPKDCYSSARPVPDFTSGIDGGLEGLRLGLPRRYFYDQLAPEVESAVEQAIVLLLDLGATIQDIEFPAASMTPVIYPIMSRPEAACFQDEFLRDRYNDYPDPLVRRSFELGELILAKDYLRAQRMRQVMQAALDEIFGEVDLLVTPTAPTTAHPIGEPYTEVDGRPIEPFDLLVGLTAPFDLTGTPALSVPCGFSPEGLPIGLQLAGRAWEEPLLLRAGAAYEQATPWHTMHPAFEDLSK
jgi:aspartyl-tRNA(Asn)/glutamyl-tRNA(Gln) amidotransferase subunit A